MEEQAHAAAASSSEPRPCSGGCGFFGSPALSNYCSVCFKKQHGEEEFKKRTNISALSTKPSTSEESQEAEGPRTTKDTSKPSQVQTSKLSQIHVEDPQKSDSGAVEEEVLTALEGQAKATLEASQPQEVVSARRKECSSETGAERDLEEERASKKAATTRCWQCRKKVGLTGFHCRCGGTFCGVHRYSDKHSCSFDYKTAGIE